MLLRPHTQRTATASPRDAYTLVEMLLVLSALLAIAGIVWPVLQTWYGHHALKEAAQDVRMRIANTRVRAIDSTVTYQFLYEPFGRNYLVLPFEAAAPDATLVSTGTAEAAQMQAVQARRVLHGRLPEGYEFRPALKDEPAGGLLPEGTLAGVQDAFGLAQVRWSQPLLFFPDGTALAGLAERSIDVYDNKPDRSYLRLTVRGLTGAVTVSPRPLREERF